MVVDWTDDASVDKLEPVLDDVCRGHSTIPEGPIVDQDMLSKE